MLFQPKDGSSLPDPVTVQFTLQTNRVVMDIPCHHCDVHGFMGWTGVIRYNRIEHVLKPGIRPSNLT